MLEDIKGVPRSSLELGLGVETFENTQKTSKDSRIESSFLGIFEGLRVSREVSLPFGHLAICKSDFEWCTHLRFMFGPCQFLQPFPVLCRF